MQQMRTRTRKDRFLTYGVSAVLIGLTLTVGLFAGMATWRTMSFERTMPDSGPVDRAVGYAFYAKLDRVLAGDEGVELDDIVTGDFVDHDGSQGAGLSIDELDQRLRTFGVTFPGARIVVDSMEIAGERLIVQVTPVAPGPGNVAGLSLVAMPMSGGIEILQIRRSRVSARWAMPLPAISGATVATTSTAIFGGDPVRASLYRIELPPGGELNWLSTGLSAVMVEDGILTVIVEATNELGRPQGEREELESGSAKLLSKSARVRLRGNSMQSTWVLLFNAYPGNSALSWPFIRKGGTTSKLLWSSTISSESDEPWHLEIGRIVVPAESDITLGNPSASEIVLKPSGAPVELTIGNGTMSQLDEQYRNSPLPSPGVVTIESAAQLSGTDTIAIGNSDDVGSSIWLLTITQPGTTDLTDATPDWPMGRGSVSR